MTNKAMICYLDLAENFKKEKRELENRLQTQELKVIQEEKIFLGLCFKNDF